jgi:hypothetical protein
MGQTLTASPITYSVDGKQYVTIAAARRTHVDRAPGRQYLDARAHAARNRIGRINRSRAEVERAGAIPLHMFTEDDVRSERAAAPACAS